MAGFSKTIFTSIKNLTIFLVPGRAVLFLVGPLKGLANLILLKSWLGENAANLKYDDYFTIKRIYDKRYGLYDHIAKSLQLQNEPITYLEFGVSKGFSFRWWLNENHHPDSKFYGFDTFEGLPEAWGKFRKGDMGASTPEVDDERATFVKGLFQETLYSFIDKNSLNQRRTIIHLDADLFTATIFVLATLHRHLKKGDILLFDEFNVPNHEFHAFHIFEDSFGIKYRVLAGANNYFQLAMEVL